ncbi:TetR family transcriptional regulator [Nocardiopsis sp. Huas11]|uniref:TetR/AcrR family transcriptional regulator n=1 Tax=Nocardiopsis sp. Huas11 TaxID=2183912 RepID=UPI000EB47264|nr:TetR/AcrR family transcriptional regulator [Nocardiopsis sp. Huas11]RKS06732.1 TetR family transcriptional regulator [Nocardiopsis sp. Huas11]
MPQAGTRAELIAATALELIAERGLRGLTHRAVDEAAGLPPGSTSYHARTRARLVEAALTWLVEQEESEPSMRTLREAGTGLDRATAADRGADFLHTAYTRDRARSLARFELALEAGRSPELREVYDRLGLRFRRMAMGLMAALGSAEPERHAGVLVHWSEGVLFDALAGAGAASPPSPEDLRSTILTLLDGMLGEEPHR